MRTVKEIKKEYDLNQKMSDEYGLKNIKLSKEVNSLLLSEIKDKKVLSKGKWVVKTSDLWVGLRTQTYDDASAIIEMLKKYSFITNGWSAIPEVQFTEFIKMEEHDHSIGINFGGHNELILPFITEYSLNVIVDEFQDDIAHAQRRLEEAQNNVVHMKQILALFREGI
jgi:hypothetical protein